MNSPDRSRRLGKGLGALLGPSAGISNARTSTPASAATPSGEQAGAASTIAVALVRPNPFQPRKQFSDQELADLEASLSASGLLQPIAVRRIPGGQGYELIAGERRLRAAGRLGWKEIPAVVHDLDDRAMLTLALVENLQRADLNAIEEAEGYQRLADEFGASPPEIAEAVGKKRTTVVNSLRLLALPASIRRLIQEGTLTAGHGRAILTLPNERAMQELARTVAQDQLSVRETEHRARTATGNRRTPRPRKPDERPAEVKRLEGELRNHLQTDVTIALKGEAKGKVVLNFYSADDFQRIVERILGSEE